jgi:16S rRNA (uracil1498-N3)-methyltransferase
VCVLVGPEGGFTDEEVDRATRAGGQAVTLGPRRLRAETAGIAVAAAVHDALG